MSFQFGAAPAPSGGGGGGGFLFGNANTPAPSSTFANNNNPTANTQQQQQQQSFGGSFGSTFGNAASSSSTGGTTTPNATPPNYVQASDFDLRFPSWKLSAKLRPIVQQQSFASRSAQQELRDVLPDCQAWLLDWSVPTIVGPDRTIRNKLQQDGQVQLRPGVNGPVNATVLHQIQSVADDLRISEVDAVSLLEQAGHAHVRQRLRSFSPIVPHPRNNTNHPDDTDTVPWAARELYFQQRRSQFQTLLQVWQWRVGAVVSLTPVPQTILQATDGLLQDGLIPKLISFVRQSTVRIGEWMSEVQRLESESPSRDSNEHQYAKLHLQCTTEERQQVCECLFFIAYHTQLECAEVAALIDLVQELTNESPQMTAAGLSLLDPVRDVPAVSTTTSPATTAWLTSVPATKKSQTEWDREWVLSVWKTGKADLARCTAILTVTIVASLETKTILMDRTTHAPNAFGMGNQLLPHGSSSVAAIEPLSQRLNRSVQDNWNRSDILGLIMGAYAMLLRSCPAALSSPRASTTGGSGDVRRLWRDCVDAPQALKSYTYGRLGLIPTLQIPNQRSSSSSSCDVSEFLLSTLSDFAANFLDALSASSDLPISRAKWEQDAEEERKLRLSNEQQEQQFAQQFQTWGSRERETTSAVPDTVNLMERHDCMDDLIAFVTAIGSLRPEFAAKFWTTVASPDNNSQLELAPSRALRALRDQQASDHTLRACYVSFLATLALAQSPDGKVDGAKLVHDMLSVEQTRDSTVTVLNWSAILNDLSFFASHCSEVGGSKVSSSKKQSRPTSTAYYYQADPRPAYEQQTASKSSSSAQKHLTLEEENIYLLTAYLTLLSNVVSQNAEARLAFMDLSVPSIGPNGGPIMGGSSLEVMFGLAGSRLSPEVRGEVFVALGSLMSLQSADSTQQEKIKLAVKKCWDLIEEHQIIPIHLLEQFPSLSPDELKSQKHFLFPPDSIALVGSSPVRSFLPADHRYSLLYEMEHVEAATGVYPSTVGFLSLLSALVKSGVCPRDLGSHWRNRPGCTPYIEYVLDMVLLRATKAVKDVPPLPFRTNQDALSVLAHAFAVVESALTNYVISDKSARAYHECLTQAQESLGMSQIATEVVSRPLQETGPFDYNFDFNIPFEGSSAKNSSVSRNGAATAIPSNFSLPATTQTDSEVLANTGGRVPGVPAVRSMGLTILTYMLSTSNPQLFGCISEVFPFLIETFPRGIDADEFAVAQSLYSATPPCYLFSRDGNQAHSPYDAIQTLRPAFLSPSTWQSKSLHERTKLAILRIMCAVIAREESLHAVLAASKQKMTTIPVLNFHRLERTFSPLKETDMHFELLARHIEAADQNTSFTVAVIECASSKGYNDDLSMKRLSNATAVIFYIERSIGAWKGCDLLIRRHDNRNKLLAGAFGSQMMCCAQHISLVSSSDLMEFVLNTLLLCLRQSSSASGRALVYTLLGLPQDSEASNWTSLTTESPSANCFGAILTLLRRQAFQSNPAHYHIESLCYEILLRVLKPRHGDSRAAASFATERLRGLGFFDTNLKLAVTAVEEVTSSANPLSMHRVHSLSWLLKLMAAEIESLCGNDGTATSNFGHRFSRKLRALQNLLMSLFDADFFARIMSVLPIEKSNVVPSLPIPPEDPIRRSKYLVKGPPEIVDGYFLVDGQKLCQAARIEEGSSNWDAFHRWSEQWNLSVMKDCASAHMGSALHTLFLSTSISLDESLVQDLETHLWFQALNSMLNRMTASYDYGTGRSLDSTLYTTATRNVAMAVLMACNVACSRKLTDTMPAFVCSKTLAILIAHSDNERTGGLGIGRKTERTAALAFALRTLLAKVPSSQTTMFDISEFQDAAIVLAGLAAAQNTTDIPHAPSTESLVCRYSLIQLIEQFSDHEEEFCRYVFTAKSFVSSGYVLTDLIAMVPRLDENISALLLTIADTKGGTSLLLQGNILDALLSAAHHYKAAVEALRPSLSTAAPYEVTELAFPSFLLNHVKLMNILLTSEDAEVKSKASELALQVSAILLLYNDQIKSLVEMFPIDGDKLPVFIKCMAQVHVCLTRDESDASSIKFMIPIGAPERNLEIESNFVRLALHLAENLLPKSKQGFLPPELSGGEKNPSAFLVASRPNPKTWWDGLAHVKEENTAEVYQMSSLAIGTINDIFIILRRSQTLLSKLDLFPLARALARCADALRWSDSYAAVYAPDQATTYRRKLSHLIEDILAMLLEQVRRWKMQNGLSDPLIQALKTAVDRVASSNTPQMGFMHALPSNENEHEFQTELLRCVSHEIGVPSLL